MEEKQVRDYADFLSQLLGYARELLLIFIDSHWDDEKKQVSKEDMNDFLDITYFIAKIHAEKANVSSRSRGGHNEED